MRRYSFYFVVGLITFGIGSFAALRFIHEINTVEETSDNTARIEKAPSPSVIQSIASEPREEKPKPAPQFICNSKALATVWRHLERTNNLRKWTVEAKEAGFGSCSDILQINERVDLNSDGIKDVIVGGKNWMVNGATGNYGTWFLLRVGRDYKVILDESAEEYAVKRSVTNGYHDILIKSHGSCCSSYQTMYKFKKGRYKESSCYYVDYGSTGVKTVTTCAEELAKSEKALAESKKALEESQSQSLVEK